MGKTSKDKKIVARNKKASYEYTLLDHYEAGIVLTGTEIKSVVNGQVSLTDAYVTVNGSSATIIGMNIAKYENGTCWNHEEKRERSLLLHKAEIRKLSQEQKQSGLTIIPVSVYIAENGKAKLDIALARGKHSYDKRESIKKREVERDIRRRLK